MIMRSQKWKNIIIKDSNLRRVRTGLRVIPKEAIRSELRRLGQIENLYRNKRVLYIEKGIDRRLTTSQDKRDNMLIEKSNELLQAWTRSILNCSMGSSCISIKRNELRQDMATLGEDMVWNPLIKRWICIHCYNYHYRTKAQKLRLQDILKQKEEEEEAFEEWFSEQIRRE